MKPEILMSQLVALIAASHETDKVQIADGELAWREEPIDATGYKAISIKWNKGKGSGSAYPFLWMVLKDVRERSGSSSKEYVLGAYCYNGDNCNERTRFIYGLMADDVDIIDDLGIIGHAKEIGETYLTKLSPTEYRWYADNTKGKTPMFDRKKGKWTYKESKERKE